MRPAAVFGVIFASALAIAAAGCAANAPHGSPVPELPYAVPNTAFTPTPPPKHLYVDHAGLLSIYALPVNQGAKPQRTLVEDPGSQLPPQIAVDASGGVAIATETEVRFFKAPITTLAPSAARLVLPLTSAVTAMGASGADLADVEFDPNYNFWLLSNIGGEVTMLRAPLSRHSVAQVNIGFGTPGTKASGYGHLIQARFDVSAALYVYASQPQGTLANVFKTGFPYAKPPSPIGLNLAQADFVDASQYLPTNPQPYPFIIGQYTGPLASPPPQQPPPPPVNALAQFAVPLDPVRGLFPNAKIDTIVGALVVNAPESRVYTLEAATGRMQVYALPLTSNAAPKVTLPCGHGPAHCNNKPERLFLAP